MKSSNYNHFINYDDVVIAYNGLKNSLIELSKSEYKQFIEYVNRDGDNQLSENFIYQLKSVGLLIEDDENEIEQIRYNMYKGRFNEKTLNLVIAPTSNCNFRCPYCFEKDVIRKGSLDEQTINSIYDFVQSKISSIQKLSITWYGGEPLLELKKIKEMSNKFIEICENYSVEYESGIITNGYLLDKETMEELIELHVSNVQITLDGYKEDHDQRRYLVNKSKTFDVIIDNLISLSEIKNFKLPYIGIRMNVDRNNVGGIFKLMDYIYKSKLKDYVFFYIAGVYDKFDTNFDYTFTQSEFIDIYNDYLEKLKNLTEINNYAIYYPEVISSHCGCDSMSTYVIDSDGSLYKCWEEIGNKKYSIGNINNEELDINNPWYYRNFVNDPTQNEKCKNCVILPNCMGGNCPHRVNQLNFKIDCERKKSELHENIIKSYKLLKLHEASNSNKNY